MPKRLIVTDYDPILRPNERYSIGLAMDEAPKLRRRLGRDDAPLSAEEMGQSVRDWLIDRYDNDDPDSASKLLDSMDELCGDPNHAGGQDRRTRRMSRDAELDFPSKPPGEEALRNAMDKRMARDAASAKSFAQRHPNAAAITPSAPTAQRRRGSATNMDDFARRHPAAAAIAVDVRR